MQAFDEASDATSMGNIGLKVEINLIGRDLFSRPKIHEENVFQMPTFARPCG